ncbi:MAG: 2Fe-2S iron-sulfur cluster binding domain-containing protein [Chloroflexi bacterium]|nr:MAG: 2Fe-2S iron-sulfur cluster binding domain-containing protein [Chloroflexota bacterium]
MPDINLTIDGHKISVPAGTLIVEAAKTVGIEIPVFCYHHKLDPVGACRLCLVDFTPGPPRPQTACTTPVAEGMVVRTQSAMAVAARADILEFELANHPLDCPVCDKGGECPLQDCGTNATWGPFLQMPDINLTIDGHKVSVPEGTLIVEAAKTVGIEIPVFCYHHKLDPVGACRLCLVDFTPGPPRPQTACTTPVAEGMVVRTQSAMAVAARADILEFELANHPLDCPVCDKGGECPLQDFTFRRARPRAVRALLPLHALLRRGRVGAGADHRRARCAVLHHEPVRPAAAVDLQRQHHRPLPRRRPHLPRMALRVAAVGYDAHRDDLLEVRGRLQRHTVAAPRPAGTRHLTRKRRHRRGLDLRSRPLRLHRRQRPFAVAHAVDPGGQGHVGGCDQRRRRRHQGQRRQARHLAAPGHHERGGIPLPPPARRSAEGCEGEDARPHRHRGARWRNDAHQGDR